jgi:hypothetical protein
MSPADTLRMKADDVENEAYEIRYREPMNYRALCRVAQELRELADNLNLKE